MLNAKCSMSKNAYIRVGTAAMECDFAVAVHCKNKKHVLGLLTKYRHEERKDGAFLSKTTQF